MALPPSTSDYVRFHALHTPRAIALIENGRKIDYKTFHRDLRKFIGALRRLGLARGSTVAVASEGMYLHWLLLLASENLGLATASFLMEESDTLSQLLAHVQLVLCTRELPRAGDRCHVMSREWLDGVDTLPEAGEEDTPLGPDEAQRVIRSSGTTGGFKTMVTTRGLEESCLARQAISVGFTQQTRLLLSTPFTVASTQRRATGALRLGAVCIRDTSMSLARSIVKYLPTHVRLFQFQMQPLLDQLPADFRKPADLTVMVAAAPLSEEMRRKLLERLASRIVYSYGTNETGTIMMVAEDGLCTPRPGVEIEVVDDHDRPVPAGVRGEVRVRTLGMLRGYLDNPELTARVFRHGWFYTGDTGTLLPSGRLKLAGRAGEVLNIGGVKIAPAVIEALVEKAVPVEGVAVTSVPNAEGIEELCIAVVLSNTANRAECAARIGKQLPRDFGKAHIKVVREIPRTEETGKVRRSELKKLFAPKGRQ